MNKREYKQMIKEVTNVINKRLNEEFVAPKKTAIEKFFSMSNTYAKRVAKAENEYYEQKRADFISLLKNAASMSDLLIISKKMLATGYKFPISGMLEEGTIPAKADLDKIKWLSYDKDTTYTAAELAKLEHKSDTTEDFEAYTYYYSWRWWIANILRCLFFWKEPYGPEASKGINEYMRKYAPKCPIVKLYPDFFKKKD